MKGLVCCQCQSKTYVCSACSLTHISYASETVQRTATGMLAAEANICSMLLTPEMPKAGSGIICNPLPSDAHICALCAGHLHFAFCYSCNTPAPRR